MHIDLEPRDGAVRTRLRSLPDEVEPPFGWQEFKQRAQRRRQIPSREWSWKATAAAAVLVLATVGAAFWNRTAVFPSGMSTPSAQVTETGQFPATAHVGTSSRFPTNAQFTTGARGAGTSGAQGNPLFAKDPSRRLETWLASLPDEPVVVHVGTRAAVAGLEDRIAQVDDILTAARLDGGETSRLSSLQQERVRLVGSLAQVRYAEVVAAQSP